MILPSSLSSPLLPQVKEEPNLFTDPFGGATTSSRGVSGCMCVCTVCGYVGVGVVGISTLCGGMWVWGYVGVGVVGVCTLCGGMWVWVWWVYVHYVWVEYTL